MLFWLDCRSTNHHGQAASNGSRPEANNGGSRGGSGHASDPTFLLDALGGESLPEKERRLSEKIMELQKLREQLLSQHNDFQYKVSHRNHNQILLPTSIFFKKFGAIDVLH